MGGGASCAGADPVHVYGAAGAGVRAESSRLNIAHGLYPRRELSDRTLDEVVGYLNTAEITDADLSDTFGPNWEHIIAFIRGVVSVTAEQWSSLVAARAAARVAGAAGDAAFAAAGVAAAAARDAAWALVARDLISETGFTQAHYDLLAGPWRTVIGRIHPDDTDLMGK